MEKKYILGLDLGTNSVGWALTDENYNVVKKQGKSLRGVRLFSEAKDCADRRSFRSNRRRMQRRKERLLLLKTLFAEEINKVDPYFLQRLEVSQAHDEDKPFEFTYTLFDGNFYNDKKFYKEYPTIYHLRKKLIYSNEKADIRHIYLALAHMIKYRGHFLFEGAKFSPLCEEDAKILFDELNERLALEPNNGKPIEIEFNKDIFEKMVEINNNARGISKLKEEWAQLLKVKEFKIVKDVIIPLMAGGKVAIDKIADFDDFSDIKTICCKDETFLENVETLISLFPQHENILECVKISKQLYDFFLLGKLLKSETYLSSAMVKRYDEHKVDLKKLKNYIKENLPDEYFNVFRATKLAKGEDVLSNYPYYIGGNRTANEGVRLKHCSQDNFYSYIKKVLGLNNYTNSDKIEDPYLKEVYDKINSGTYLQRQNSSDNGVFPYQLNEIEMEIILNKQKQYYSFLNDVDDKYTTNDKIVSILKYKIPYYVGPLAGPKNEELNNFSWVVRTKEKIYPWNFNEVVNLDESAEAFIKRMLNKCTYLPSCDTLPKNSLVFSYFTVLNEINKIFVNGEFITYEQKIKLISDLYLHHRVITKKMLLKYFATTYGNDVSITTSHGKELEEVHSSLTSLYDFSNIFGLDFVKENLNMTEDIIRDIVLFTDKRILQERLRKKYGIKDESIINKIKTLNYVKYGTLSKELLLDLRAIDENGVVSDDSILSLMEKTNLNLMEVINKDEYGFLDSIKLFNEKHNVFGNIDRTPEGVKKYIDTLYVSPLLKRPLIQAYKIVEELEHIIKHPIDEYYIECTRGKEEIKAGKSNRKDSRYFYTLNLYNEAIKQAEGVEKERLSKLKDSLLKYETDQTAFKSDKIFLYFTQLGRCLYTGETINFDDLVNGDRYDIDHIYPQSIIKDDSFNNRVLVTSNANRAKSDKYPVPFESLSGNFNAHGYIKMLRKLNLISESKENRLLRTSPLSDDELFQFVNRQLVITNQGVKALVELLKHYKATEEFKPLIDYSRASDVSDFRKKYDILKCREVNNFHHAHDAYLNVVVGRVMHYYFKFVPGLEGISKLRSEGKTTNIAKIYDDYDNGGKENIKSGNYIIWDYKNTLSKVKNQIYNHYDIMVTTRTYCGNELFLKTTIEPASNYKEGNLLPRKQQEENLSFLSDSSKYGGFSSLSFGYYALVKSYDKKNNEIYSIEAVPNILSKDKLLQYFAEKGLRDPKIVIDKLKINTIIKHDDVRFCITGKTSNRLCVCNLRELNLNKHFYDISRKVCKSLKLLENLNNKKEYDLMEDEQLDLIVSFAKDKNDKKNKNNVLTRKECDELLDFLMEKCTNSIYKDYSIFEKLLNYVSNNRDIINNLKIGDYVITLCEILKLFKCNPATSNLEKIGMDKNAGKLRISKNINPKYEIISESITGFYTKILWKL